MNQAEDVPLQHADPLPAPVLGRLGRAVVEPLHVRHDRGDHRLGGGELVHHGGRVLRQADQPLGAECFAQLEVLCAWRLPSELGAHVFLSNPWRLRLCVRRGETLLVSNAGPDCHSEGKTFTDGEHFTVDGQRTLIVNFDVDFDRCAAFFRVVADATGALVAQRASPIMFD